MKRILFFRKFSFTLLLILAAGLFVVPAGYANIKTSGDVDSSYDNSTTDFDPSDPSTWTKYTHLYIGYSDTGTLSVSNGSTLTSADSYIGYLADSTGTVTVTGTGSSWTSNLTVGYSGTGILNITDGGTVSTGSGYAFVAQDYGSTGTVNVDGTGSLWAKTYGHIYIGSHGTGTLNITNGGAVTCVGILYINGDGSTVNVDGAGSSLTTGRWIDLSGDDTTLNITNGGTAVADGGVHIGYENDSTSTLTVDGTGSSLTGYDFRVGFYGTGTLNIINGGAVETDTIAYLGYHNGSTGSVTVDGEGSSWTIGEDLYLGYWSTGILNVADGGTVSASYVYINSNSTATVDVNSSLSVGTEEDNWTGDIDNDGTIRLVAGAGADSGTYTPISYGTMSTDGTVQALGGVWDEDAHTITVSDAVKAEGAGGATATLDLSKYQRALITDTITDTSAGASFLAADESTSISFTATAVTDEDLLNGLSGLIADTDEDILSVWDFSSNNYDDEVYLSLFAGSADDILDLTIWYLVDGEWTEYDATDLAFDGTYASFTVDELGTYAVTGVAGVSSVPVPGAVWLLGTGMLGLAGLNRKRRK